MLTEFGYKDADSMYYLRRNALPCGFFNPRGALFVSELLLRF